MFRHTLKMKKQLSWIKEIVALTKPDEVYWCDGSQTENDTYVSTACEIRNIHKIE